MTDTRNHRIVVYNQDLQYQFAFGGHGVELGNFSVPVRPSPPAPTRALVLALVLFLQPWSFLCYQPGSSAYF